MILKESKVVRAGAIQLANQMEQRAWDRYRFSLDTRHADNAEWWRERAEKAMTAEDYK